MEQPLVTVFTVTRNRADLLPRCMKSILNQTYKNIEYIVIDSASTDNTEDVVKSFNDERIKYIKLEENRTCGACFNMAYEMATGKYVTGLDDDDEYHLDKIEKQVALFETLPEDYGMVYCWMTYFDNKTHKVLNVHKAELRGDVIKDVIARPTVSGTPTMLIKTDVVRKLGGYKEAKDIGIESDWELAARICNASKVDYVPESLIRVYVNHGHQRMSDDGYYIDTYRRTIQFHLDFLSEFAEDFEKYPSSKEPHYLMICRSYFKLGEIKQSFRYYKLLVRSHFSLRNLLYFPFLFFTRIVSR